MRRLLIPLLLLAGAWPAPAARPAPLPQNGESGSYTCSDGRAFDVLYGGGDAVLTIGDTPAEMTRVVPGDGELYRGGGRQWRVTGRRSGMLGGGDAGGEVACRIR